jgi:hypothetical protein
MAKKIPASHANDNVRLGRGPKRRFSLTVMSASSGSA